MMLGIVPFLGVLAVWWAAPHLVSYPPYVMPSPAEVGARLWEIGTSGQLFREVGASLVRLLIAFAVGNLIALPLGILIAMNATAARIILPVVVFFQSIAGIAWAPLAVLWFGIGSSAVIFLSRRCSGAPSAPWAHHPSRS
jgi:NitT/TauT family transport system permease protein/taurine transport system permease protein